MDDLLGVVEFHREIGEVIPKLRCDRCHQPPARIETEMKWAKKYGASLPREDLTFLLPSEVEKAA